MSFHVGQKVVCIDDSQLRNHRWDGDAPVKGEIYTVDGFVETYRGTGVLLREIINHEEFLGSYNPSRFRHVIDRKTDISFTEGAPKDSEKYDNRRKVEVQA